MGIFKSKDHLFNDFEIYDVDRSFLNLQRYIKNFEFDQIAKTNDNDGNKFCYSTIDYDYFINKRRVRFCCCKRTIKNFDLYFDYYETHMGSKTDTGYIGLPSLSDMEKAKSLFPLKVLELKSVVLIKEKHQGRNRERFIDASDKYYLWIAYKENKSWEDELVKDFKTITNKLINETLKNLSKLKKNQ